MIGLHKYRVGLTLEEVFAIFFALTGRGSEGSEQSRKKIQT